MKKTKSSKILFNKKPYYYQEHSSGLSKVVNNYVRNYPLSKNGELISTPNQKVKVIYNKDTQIQNDHNNWNFENKILSPQSVKETNYFRKDKTINVKANKNLSSEINNLKKENDELKEEIDHYKTKIKILENDIFKLMELKNKQTESIKKTKENKPKPKNIIYDNDDNTIHSFTISDIDKSE